jgi:hypothetical protein
VKNALPNKAVIEQEKRLSGTPKWWRVERESSAFSHRTITTKPQLYFETGADLTNRTDLCNA